MLSKYQVDTNITDLFFKWELPASFLTEPFYQGIRCIAKRDEDWKFTLTSEKGENITHLLSELEHTCKDMAWYAFDCTIIHVLKDGRVAKNRNELNEVLFGEGEIKLSCTDIIDHPWELSKHIKSRTCWLRKWALEDALVRLDNATDSKYYHKILLGPVGGNHPDVYEKFLEKGATSIIAKRVGSKYTPDSDECGRYLISK